MRRVLVTGSLVLPGLLLAVSCADRNPAGPTSSATLDGFVQALRQQGLSVSVAGQIPPEVNRFFSVPADQIRVNDGQVNAFVYATPQDAAGEAGAISAAGQPSPTGARHVGQHAAVLPPGFVDRAVRRDVQRKSRGRFNTLWARQS